MNLAWTTLFAVGFILAPSIVGYFVYSRTRYRALPSLQTGTAISICVISAVLLHIVGLLICRLVWHREFDFGTFYLIAIGHEKAPDAFFRNLYELAPEMLFYYFSAIVAAVIIGKFLGVWSWNSNGMRLEWELVNAIRTGKNWTVVDLLTDSGFLYRGLFHSFDHKMGGSPDDSREGWESIIGINLSVARRKELIASKASEKKDWYAIQSTLTGREIAEIIADCMMRFSNREDMPRDDAAWQHTAAALVKDKPELIREILRRITRIDTPQFVIPMHTVKNMNFRSFSIGESERASVD